MNRALGKLSLLGVATSVLLGLGLSTLTGCESGEVGSVKLPEVKDKAEILPGFNPEVKSPYSAGASNKKKKAGPTEADKALPANNNPSL